MRSLAILIALLFLGATAQCTFVCVQPKHAPPCHQQKSTTCSPLVLTAEKSVTAVEVPTPVFSPLPVPVLTVSFIAIEPLRLPQLPPGSSGNILVLLI